MIRINIFEPLTEEKGFLITFSFPLPGHSRHLLDTFNVKFKFIANWNSSVLVLNDTPA